MTGLFFLVPTWILRGKKSRCSECVRRVHVVCVYTPWSFSKTIMMSKKGIEFQTSPKYNRQQITPSITNSKCQSKKRKNPTPPSPQRPGFGCGSVLDHHSANTKKQSIVSFLIPSNAVVFAIHRATILSTSSLASVHVSRFFRAQSR